MTRALLSALVLVLAAGCGPRTDGDAMTVLTVSGRISEANRPEFDAATDKYFAWLGVDFPAARGFTRADLAAMAQHRLQAAPEALPPGLYEGPLLADVLDRAGAAPDAEAALAYAMDGYSALIPMTAIRDSGAVVALTRDGAPLPIGGAGPAMIVFPDASGASPDWFVWALVLIEIE